jgi:hypothetical protein
MTADQQAAGAASPAPASAMEAGCLHGRFAIDPNAPLAEFTTPSARAFAAVDLRYPSRHLFALICEPDLPVRAAAREQCGQTVIPGLMQITDHGIIDWPPRKGRCEAIVYPRPRGGALGAGYGHGGRSVSEYAISRRIVPPIAKAFRALDALALAHRAIRLDNMFFIDNSRDELVLGDCLAAPAGFNQPVLFEPIERALASPGGRGEGRVTDDLYALGVCLAILLIGDNPVAGQPDETVLMARMERGSYSVLCERQRIPLAMIEPLRGLLCDDAPNRWDLDELERWLKGQRLSRSRPPSPLRPSSAFVFGGQQHWSLRTLAHAFGVDVSAAATVTREGHLENWLRLRAKSDALANAVVHEVALASNRKGAAGSDDAFVARLAMVLDPSAPISYRALRFMPDGLGPALALAWLKDGDAQSAGEVLALDLAGQWLAARAKSAPEFGPLRKDYARLCAFVDNRAAGYGLERCLYETNPGLPCQSPLIKNAHVVSLEMLLPALEEAASSADRDSLPMDRHLAAFVAARWEQGAQPHLGALADPRPESAIVGTIGIFAALQRRYALASLPRLSQWIGGMLNVVAATYHNRVTRAELERDLQEICRQGRFPELYSLVTDGDRREADAREFADSMAEFAAIAAEINALESTDPETDAHIREGGQRVAATLSVLGSGLAASIVVVSYLW